MYIKFEASNTPRGHAPHVLRNGDNGSTTSHPDKNYSTPLPERFKYIIRTTTIGESEHKIKASVMGYGPGSELGALKEERRTQMP